MVITFNILLNPLAQCTWAIGIDQNRTSSQL